MQLLPSLLLPLTSAVFSLRRLARLFLLPVRDSPAAESAFGFIACFFGLQQSWQEMRKPQSSLLCLVYSQSDHSHSY